MEQKTWLITGCSTGLGRAFAKYSATQGDKVIATVRNENQINDLESLSPNIRGVILDVSKQTTIDHVISLIKEEYSERVDVLVNNAGYGAIGPVEEISEQEMQRQFDINVFGCVRMIKAVLPFMRRNKSGHVINVTSIAGLNGFPGVGIYNGSKFALEGIGEALAAETKHLGIHVTNVEPGPFRTDWAGRSATFTGSQIEDYNDSANKNMADIQSVSGTQIGDPDLAAKAVFDLTRLENPPVHLPLGAPAYKRARIKFNEILREIDEFEYLGLPTDFPQE